MQFRFVRVTTVNFIPIGRLGKNNDGYSESDCTFTNELTDVSSRKFCVKKLLSFVLHYLLVTYFSVLLLYYKS